MAIVVLSIVISLFENLREKSQCSWLNSQVFHVLKILVAHLIITALNYKTIVDQVSAAEKMLSLEKFVIVETSLMQTRGTNVSQLNIWIFEQFSHSEKWPESKQAPSCLL